MTAQLLDGKAVAADIRAGLARRVAALAARGPAAAGGTPVPAVPPQAARPAPGPGSARSWSATTPAAAPT